MLSSNQLDKLRALDAFFEDLIPYEGTDVLINLDYFTNGPSGEVEDFDIINLLLMQGADFRIKHYPIEGRSVPYLILNIDVAVEVFEC